MLSKNSLDFFEKFLQSSGPSGFEEPCAKVFREYVGTFADAVETDVLGNTAGILNPKAKFRVMLAGHYDEIGFQVVDVTERGLVTFRVVGGIDKVTLPGIEVEILSSATGKKIPGVIGRKPIHLQTPKERETVMEISDLWIDIGCESRKEAEKLLNVGDPIAMKVNVKRLGKNAIMSKGLDDKIGAFVIAEALRILKEKKTKIGVWAVGTVQEELGCRGATTGTFAINPNVGVCVDVTFATDIPGVDRKQYGNVVLGGGGVVARNANVNPVLYNHFIKTAKAKKIPYQVSCGNRASGGTDTAMMQLAGSGTATILVSVPNRYMHTPVEVCDLRDAEYCAKLIAEAVASLDTSCKFRPGID